MKPFLILLLALCGSCCERQRLLPGSVLLSDSAIDALAFACRVSDANSEQEMVVMGIQRYLQELHLKTGEDPQNCRAERDSLCRIVNVNCAAAQSPQPPTPACQRILDGPPDEKPYYLPCYGACSSGKRIKPQNIILLEAFSLLELDKIASDTSSADRAQALERVIAHVRADWQKRRAAVDFQSHRANHPTLRALDAPCPRYVRYERM
jgi:hypothetical protein